MAKKKPEIKDILDGQNVELICIKNDTVYKKIMEYSEAVSVLKNKHESFKKKPGWIYKIYKIGESQFNNVKEI